MHVPDGFLDAPTSVATGVVAAGAVAVALRKARNELDERTAPMAGLVAAFIFAAQMLNFPVGAGTSGHLLGGALAAVLVGPWTAILCMSAVLLVQGTALRRRRADALGTNIILMGDRHGRRRLGGVQGSSPRHWPRPSARSSSARSSPGCSPCRSRPLAFVGVVRDRRHRRRGAVHPAGARWSAGTS